MSFSYFPSPIGFLLLKTTTVDSIPIAERSLSMLAALIRRKSCSIGCKDALNPLSKTERTFAEALEDSVRTPLVLFLTINLKRQWQLWPQLCLTQEFALVFCRCLATY